MDVYTCMYSFSGVKTQIYACIHLYMLVFGSENADICMHTLVYSRFREGKRRYMHAYTCIFSFSGGKTQIYACIRLYILVFGRENADICMHTLVYTRFREGKRRYMDVYTCIYTFSQLKTQIYGCIHLYVLVFGSENADICMHTLVYARFRE